MICGQEFTVINWTHLKTHGYTTVQYRQEFPEAPLWSEATKQKVSKSVIKRFQDPKEREKRSEGVKRYYNDDLMAREKASQRGKTRWKDPKFRSKMDTIHKSPETRKKMSKSRKKIFQDPREREKMSKKKKEYYKDPRAREKNRQSQLIAQNRPKVKARSRETALASWQDPEFAQKIFKGLAQRPTGLEVQVMSILNSLFPGEYVYNGGCELGIVLCGKIPDFPNINGKKKVIEAYGSYWHTQAEEQERTALFATIGWDCCIIWDHELGNFEELEAKLQAFHARESSPQITLDNLTTKIKEDE